VATGKSFKGFIIVYLALARPQTSFNFSLQQTLVNHLKSSILLSANLFGKIKIKRNR